MQRKYGTVGRERSSWSFAIMWARSKRGLYMRQSAMIHLQKVVAKAPAALQTPWTRGDLASVSVFLKKAPGGAAGVYSGKMDCALATRCCLIEKVIDRRAWCYRRDVCLSMFARNWDSTCL